MKWLRSQLARVATAALAGRAGSAPAGVLDEYTSSPPDRQNALDIFKGEWASSLPAPFQQLRAGASRLFEDPRVTWVVEQVGGVAGMRVLELGPLEGGHSYMLDRAGAKQVVAIESNSRAFLKCLIVKELLGMPSVQFVHGDFTAYLTGTPDRVDLVFASGVLYHMVNPVQVIAAVSQITDRVFIWTHYYDETLLAANAATAHRVVTPTPSEHRGYHHQLYRHEYLAALAHRGFCGGSRPFANWMTQQGILDALRHFGFTRLELHSEQPDHPHGPAFSVLARRDGARP